MTAIKHNKKRNTAFLYKVLLMEASKALLNKEDQRRTKIVNFIKENFSANTAAGKELYLYQQIMEDTDIPPRLAKSYVQQLCENHSKIDKKKLFDEQTKIINKINNEIGSHVFENFVKDYRMLGTAYQMFNSPENKVKDKIKLQESVAAQMVSAAERNKKKLEPIDKITYNVYVKKFNEKFSELLNGPQKKLMKEYIYSVKDGGLSFKLLFTEEVERIREFLKEFLKEETDLDVSKEKIEKVVEKIESFKGRQLDDTLIKEVMVMQELVEELKKDD